MSSCLSFQVQNPRGLCRVALFESSQRLQDCIYSRSRFCIIWAVGSWVLSGAPCTTILYKSFKTSLLRTTVTIRFFFDEFVIEASSILLGAMWFCQNSNFPLSYEFLACWKVSVRENNLILTVWGLSGCSRNFSDWRGFNFKLDLSTILYSS